MVKVGGRAWPQIFSALRYADYRWYWLGLVVSVVGLQIQFIAQSWLVYDLTNSPLYLGVVGLFSAVPSIILSLFGGVIADRVDRRRLMMITQSSSAILVLLLGVLVTTGLIQVWHILAIAFVSGVVMAFDMPTRQALIPHLIGKREDLMNAIALGTSVWQASRIVGPAIAGILIASVGTATCFFITSAGFLVMVGAIYKIRPLERVRVDSMGVWHNLRQGIGFVSGNPVFSTLIGLTLFNSVFGLSVLYIMPVFARDILGVGAQGYGYLAGASGLGALVGTLVVASLGNSWRRGWPILGGAASFGLGLILFSLSRSYSLSLAMAAVIGLASAVYMTLINTTLQSEVPDGLRGRVMGIYTMAFSLMPLGGLQVGAVAELVSAPFAVAVGGIVVGISALAVAARFPHVRNL